jgi:CRISPR-associated protein Csh1
MISGQSWRAPWIKQAPYGPYLHPVFKVEPKKGGAKSKRKFTLKRFRRFSKSQEPVAHYFKEVRRVLLSRRLVKPGGQGSDRVLNAYTGSIDYIVAHGKEFKEQTPLLIIILDSEGDTWPGDEPLFVGWLLNSPERLTIYGPPTPATHPAASCSLCGQRGPLYANALPGAGLNFVNGAFRGSFPELREDRAWQRFAICSECADLIYVYKNHVAPNFLDKVVGSNCLIVPSANVNSTEVYGRFLARARAILKQADRAQAERQVLRTLATSVTNEGETLATLSFLWAEGLGERRIGQKIEDIRGLVTHVLPTRLAELHGVNKHYNDPLVPNPFRPLDLHARRDIDLNLRLAEELTHRPGGNKVKAENQSPRRFAMLRELAACVFHARRLDPRPLWYEVDRTAEAYWVALLGEDNRRVLDQCRSETAKRKGDRRPTLTLNGWARHLYVFLSYLADERVGVLPKEISVYEATQESLRPLLSQAEGLDSDEKRFTFLLGILYGHLIYVQARKAEVNVAANALSWMRGGRLRAAELHELYGKVTSKLLEYDALEVGRYRKWRQIFELEAELAHLGKRLRVPIEPGRLPDEQVLYFLMLGIALSYDFTTSGLPKDQGEGR